MVSGFSIFAIYRHFSNKDLIAVKESKTDQAPDKKGSKDNQSKSPEEKDEGTD